jgi:predicted RNase H-like HicB family nuclease
MSCPELAEARFSGLSREAALANVDGLAALLHGSFVERGRGFDRLLTEKGAATLVDDMEQALEAARQALDAVPAPIHEAVVTNLPSVHAAHAAVKAYTDLLKGPFVTVLSLTVPAEGAGDND